MNEKDLIASRKKETIINTDKEKVYNDFLLKEYKKAQLTLK